MRAIKTLGTEALALTWVRPCPASGSGNRDVHHWIMKAAKAFALRRLPIDKAHEIIARAIPRNEKPRGEIAEALEKAYGIKPGAKGKPKVEAPAYSIDKLIAYASQCPVDVTEDWLAEVSPECLLNVSPSEFLQCIYEPGECVCVTTAWGKDEDGEPLWRKKAAIWTDGDARDSLNRFKTGEDFGAWFLSNPVTGTCIDGSWRSGPNVTSWRYAVIESDKAPVDLWLRALVRLNLPIAAVYESGGESIHALARIEATDLDDSNNTLRYGKHSLLSETTGDRRRSKCANVRSAHSATGMLARRDRARTATFISQSQPQTPTNFEIMAINTENVFGTDFETDTDGTDEKEGPRATNQGANNTQEEPTTNDAKSNGGRNDSGNYYTLPTKEMDRFRFEQMSYWLRWAKYLHAGEMPPELDIVASLKDRRPFPVECLPKSLRDLAESVALSTRTPVVISIAAGMSVVAASLGCNLGVISNPGDEGDIGECVFGNLYILPIKESGEGKTRASKFMLKPLYDLHRLAQEEWKERRREAKSELDDIKERIDEAKKELKRESKIDIVEVKRRLAELYEEQEEAEEAMIKPDLYTGSTTEAALAKLLKDNNEVMNAIASEAGDAVQILAGKYNNAAKGEVKTSDTVLLSAYCQEECKSDRTTQECIDLNGPTVNLLWMVQPRYIPTLFGNDSLASGGFLARCLSFYSYSEIEDLTGKEPPVSMALKKAFYGDVDALFKRFKSSEQVTLVNAEPDAREVMRLYENECRKMRRTELRDIKQFPARWTENAWKIAVGLHAMEYLTHAGDKPLKRETAECAIKIMDWFANEFLELMKAGREDKADAEGLALAEYITRKGRCFSEGAKEVGVRPVLGKLPEHDERRCRSHRKQELQASPNRKHDTGARGDTRGQSCSRLKNRSQS